MPPQEGTIDDAVNAAEEAQGRGEGKGAGKGPAAGVARESIFDSIGGSIDSLVKTVKAIPKIVSKAAYYTYYTAKAAVGLGAGFLMGGAHALILPAGIALGAMLGDLKNKEKITYKKIANELCVGGFLGGLLSYIFKGIAYTGKVAQAAYGTTASLLTRGAGAIAQMPVFLGAHEYLNRALIADYKPKPLSDMGKNLKKMWPIIPPIIANFTFVPDYLGESYQMPVAAGVSTAYGLLKGDKKEEKKEAKAQPDLNQMLQQYQPRPA